ncbi:Sphingomyelin phosphodiesterase 3 [Takifugu flavidus]|uniref:Sphingomyelin phosphodiesterase 3 n=1 Tax=Takifugu flavidus TaxID=433684 RepID=A0A5C6P9L2_9TELE|nr:Sphingomyelin phosphodiesterase 3 [Takifugu flavidus]
MVLHISPYSCACLHFLDGLSWSLVFPCYWLLDRLLASCVATSLEKHQRSQDPCSFLSLCILISAPLYLVLLLTSLPFALLGFVIWAPLQAVRQPYLYTYRRPDKHHAEQGQAGPGLGTGEWRPQGRSFSFCSANVCLLPDSLARFNNLSDTHRRAREVPLSAQFTPTQEIWVHLNVPFIHWRSQQTALSTLQRLTAARIVPFTTQGRRGSALCTLQGGFKLASAPQNLSPRMRRWKHRIINLGSRQEEMQAAWLHPGSPSLVTMGAMVALG